MELPSNVEESLKVRRETIKQRKKRFLKTYKARLCNVSKCCEVCGISRQTYYQWMNKDDKFKKAIEDEREAFYDDLETTMYSKAITDKDTAMLIWISKTKMKDRGYVEKMEQDVTVNPFLELMQEATSERNGE
ncbi:MAG: hypothetical protein PHF34_04400 [Bacteroidales bacterium]|nr:hypothetical protein [Bacteroidales bacterium]